MDYFFDRFSVVDDVSAEALVSVVSVVGAGMVESAVGSMKKKVELVLVLTLVLVLVLTLMLVLTLVLMLMLMSVLVVSERSNRWYSRLSTAIPSY